MTSQSFDTEHDAIHSKIAYTMGWAGWAMYRRQTGLDRNQKQEHEAPAYSISFMICSIK